MRKTAVRSDVQILTEPTNLTQGTLTNIVVLTKPNLFVKPGNHYHNINVSAYALGYAYFWRLSLFVFELTPYTFEICIQNVYVKNVVIESTLNTYQPCICIGGCDILTK